MAFITEDMFITVKNLSYKKIVKSGLPMQDKYIH